MSDKCRNCGEPLEGFETTLCYTCQGEKNECDEAGQDFWAMSEEDQEMERWQEIEIERLKRLDYADHWCDVLGQSKRSMKALYLNHDEFVYNGEFDEDKWRDAWKSICHESVEQVGIHTAIPNGAFCTIEHTYHEYVAWHERELGPCTPTKQREDYVYWMDNGVLPK
jgi:hypothetical protein